MTSVYFFFFFCLFGFPILSLNSSMSYTIKGTVSFRLFLGAISSSLNVLSKFQKEISTAVSDYLLASRFSLMKEMPFSPFINFLCPFLFVTLI